jgi:hypothetical protein
MAFFAYDGGGDDPTRVALALGRGDGSFVTPAEPILVHNIGDCGSSPANSLLFGDFDGDRVGDVLMGFDDDGDAGSAWLYPGTVKDGSFRFDLDSCREAVDITPSAESGSEHPGFSRSAQAYDFDHDGALDIIVGYNHQEPWEAPSKVSLIWGRGDGSFEDDSPLLVRDFPDSSLASRVAIPQRVGQSLAGDLNRSTP